MIKIDVWSDYACPYCFIGEMALRKAIQTTNSKEVNIVHHAYLLEPGKINHPERTFFEGLNLTNDAEINRVKHTFHKVSQLGSEFSIAFELYKALDVSTFDAHRLTLWAQHNNYDLSIYDLIFKAYFCEGKDISSHDLLLSLVKQTSIPIELSKILLENDSYSDEVFEDFDLANNYDIELIPHYIFNHDQEVGGIMTVDKFADILTTFK